MRLFTFSLQLTVHISCELIIHKFWSYHEVTILPSQPSRVTPESKSS